MSIRETPSFLEHKIGFIRLYVAPIPMCRSQFFYTIFCENGYFSAYNFSLTVRSDPCPHGEFIPKTAFHKDKLKLRPHTEVLPKFLSSAKVSDPSSSFLS